MQTIFIDNAADPRFASRLPPWWIGSLSSARSFVLLPLSSHGQPVGLIYADWDHDASSQALGAAEFALLGELRALIVRSAERRQKSAA